MSEDNSGARPSKAEAAREALYAEAARAGFTVTRSSSGTVDVFKTRKMPNGGIMVTRGIRVYPNWTAFSLTVNLSEARALRGIAALRRALDMDL